MLIAYAESDLYNDRTQVMEDGIHKTYGIFQQSDRFWGTKEQILDIKYATVSCFNAISSIPMSNNPTADCWYIQRWRATSPDTNITQFSQTPETQNYLRRVSKIQGIITISDYFTKGYDTK